MNYKLYKLYRIFRYDIWEFFGNLWNFRKELWHFRGWDYYYTLIMLHKCLQLVDRRLENGQEIPETLNKKRERISRVLYLLNGAIESHYIDRAEEELGPLNPPEFVFKDLKNGTYEVLDERPEEKQEHDRKVFKLSREIEEREWNEIWDIIRGTENSKLHNEDFDGSGLRNWWD
jgi:hypothetical protein